MNFDFSEEQKQFAEEVRRFFSEQMGFDGLRRFVESGEKFHKETYAQMAALGWLGVTFPEQYGGLDLPGYELCILCEEAGKWVVPVPLSSSICIAGEAINRFGSAAQKERWLAKLAMGEVVATFAYCEGPGGEDPAHFQTNITKGRLSGRKWPVPDGGAADVAVVVAHADNGSSVLTLVDLHQPGVSRRDVEAMDLVRPHVILSFDNVEAEILGGRDDVPEALEDLLDTAATYTAFEQVGGAQAAFDLALKYVQERHAFGRQIGSYQALKHKLADLFVDIELARSNAYYAAWALAEQRPEKRLAAATARVSATEAFKHAAREALHVHGGVGYTYEYNCHWFYRRERLLAVSLLGENFWNNRLIDQLETELVE